MPSIFDLKSLGKVSYNLLKKITSSSERKNDSIDRVHRTYATAQERRADSWMNVLTGLGIRGRDKNASTTYRMECLISYQQLDMLYRGDGMVKRIIELIPQEMMRQGFKVDTDSDDKILKKIEELNGFQKITNLLIWSRLYGGSIIVMGIDDGREMDEPVDEENIRDIKWLHVFDRYEAFSADGWFEQNLNSPNYGFPNMYTVNDCRTGITFNVHYSRILRVDWSVLPIRLQNMNNGWADSCIQSIYEELKNYSSAFANAGVIVQDFVNGVLSIPDLSLVMASQCNNEQVQNRLNLLNMIKSVLNTTVIDANEKYEKMTTNIAGLSDLLDRFAQTLSSVTGIPVTLLFGQSAAGLHATGDNDVRNFYDMVKTLQESKLKPVLEKLVKYLFLSKYGATNGVEPDNWSIKFVPLWQNTQEQEANIRRTVAETDRIYIETGVLDAAEVAVSRFGGDTWSMNTEIDLVARQNGFDPEEVAELEAKKIAEEKKESPDPSIGPDNVNRVTYRRPYY